MSPAHPSYPEMIIAAIKAHYQTKRSKLRVRLRVSRRKISEYITRTYTGLPSNSGRILSFHLEKMTKEGSLKVDRQWFVLPVTSSGSNPIAESPKTLSTPSVGPKRKPAPKSKPKNTYRPAKFDDCTPKTEPNDETIVMSDEPWPEPITPTKSNTCGGQAPTLKRGHDKPARVKADVGPNGGPVVGHVAAEETKRCTSLSGKPLGRPKTVGRSSSMDMSAQLQPPPIAHS